MGGFGPPVDGSLHFSALVRLHYLPAGAPPLQGEELITGKVVLIERTRSGSDWPGRRLQALSRPGVPPIFLTSLTLEAQDVIARGLAPWPAQARDWAPLVDLELRRLEWTQPDACQHSSVEGRFSKPADHGSPPPKGPAEGPALLLGGALEHWCAVPAPSPRPLGVSISPPGRIRRVARGRRPAALSLPPGSEAPVTFWFRRGVLADVFALLADISGDGVMIPPDRLPPASVYAAEMPRDVLYQAIATSAGLSLRHEPGLFRVEREGLSVSDLMGTVGGTRGRRGGFEAMTGDQVELSALTASGKAWTAWMLTPHGTLLEYKASDRFWNGQVVSVDSRGVDLRIDISDPLAKERFRTRRLDLPPGS